MSRAETRADTYGIKPGVLKRKTGTTFDRMRRDVQDLAVAWEDAGGLLTSGLDDLGRLLDEVEAKVPAFIAHLRQPLDDD